jgi:cytoskeletal protein RodZ
LKELTLLLYWRYISFLRPLMACNPLLDENYTNKMALSLGEKLQQAREARGISISEVAEQTRISSHYLEGIEANDYRTLPGGIFNKGFVKSYAKYVGIDEQEALQDYAKLVASQENEVEDDFKTYNPQVLTDDRSSSSKVSTIIFAIIILGLMTWGILALIPYLQGEQSGVVTATPTPDTTTNTNVAETNTSDQTNSNTTADADQPLPSTDEIKVDFKPLDEPISVEATVDGEKQSSLVSVEEPKTFEAKESLKLRYYRGFADKVKLTLNGKEIAPPAEPKIKNAQGIEFEINKSNITEILQSGKITFESAENTADAENTNTAPQ